MHFVAANSLQYVSWMIVIGMVVVGGMIGLSFAAFVLKAACRCVGEDAPDTSQAMIISFLESLVGTVAYVAAGFVLPLALNTASAGRETAMASLAFAAVTISLAVPAGLYVPMLKVSFGKGLAIAVLRYVIIVALAAALVCAVMASGKFKFA